MDRYFYKPDDAYKKFHLFDRFRGQGDKYEPTHYALATCKDVDTAQRIVDLLNADDRLKEQAAAAIAAQRQIEAIIADDTEQQRLKKLIEARESLGSEIVDVIPGTKYYKERTTK